MFMFFGFIVGFILGWLARDAFSKLTFWKGE